MKFKGHLKDIKLILVYKFIITIMFGTYLLNKQIPFLEVITIIICLLVFDLSYIYLSFYLKKKRQSKIKYTIENLDNMNLFTEIFELSKNQDDLFYFEIIKICNIDMLNKINKIEQNKQEYKEYIEQWIHEVKIPITSIKLICDNKKTDDMYKILKELEIISGAIEQTLFYARSDTVEKDYLIQDIDLKSIITKMLIKNKQMLIQNNIKINIFEQSFIIKTDPKWIEFIITQIIYNSIKYRNKNKPIITFDVALDNNNTILDIIDNGIGIKQADLGRVFDKGFTGENGRNTLNSTGIGLYLCEKLSNKLNIKIKIKSQVDYGTTISLIF